MHETLSVILFLEKNRNTQKDYCFSEIANDIALHTNGVVSYLNSQLKECYSNKGKCRKGSTPYASKRKKKRKK